MKTVLTSFSLLTFGIKSSNALEAHAGDSVKCINNSDGSGVPNRVYRLTCSGETLRAYPSMDVANSWDDEWHVPSSQKKLDCTDMKIGKELPLKPDNLREYDTIVCDPESTLPGKLFDLYRFTDDELRPYPTFQIARSWDSNWENNVKEIDCAGFDVGDDMPPYPSAVKEGDAVSCIIDTDESGGRPNETYRFSKGKLRDYPVPEIAGTWDTTWESHVVKIDCTGIKTGPDMTMKPADLIEGDAIKCMLNSDLSDNEHKVYRFTGGKIRWYPDPTIAFSWDSDWPTTIKLIDCNGVPIGHDMPFI